MTSESKRTLVKSAPELWELADDLARMEAWMGGLVGEPGTVPVQVTERQPEQLLAFAAGEDPEATIAIELSESGFGTAVRITASHSSPQPELAGAVLEGLLDELGSPARRPFS